MLEFLLRLAIAGILGGMIGFERAYRSKDAGLRTHFLVALGSALFMIVSQHGFYDMEHLHPFTRLDVSRVAAQIVSGIGFLGAGMIFFQRQTVKGLTTAAGMWVVAAIGMAVGGGLYLLGMAATVLTLIGFEVLRIIGSRMPTLSERVAQVSFKVPGEPELEATLARIEQAGGRVVECSSKRESKSSLHVTLSLSFRERRGDAGVDIFTIVKSIPGVKLRKFE